MSKDVPNSLRIWFKIHFILDYVIGIPLLLIPIVILEDFGWQTIDPFATRLVGAILIGIGSISLLENRSGIETYNTLLNLKLIMTFTAIIAVLLSLMEHGFFMGYVIGIVLVLYFFLWSYYKYRIG
tara:strand:- start:2632 stop:3009 length:378 start_codon:yes stop_codon:yes gene_type:complete